MSPGTDLCEAEELLREVEPPPPEQVRPRVSRPLAGQAFVHVLSGIAHSAAGPGMLRCGRRISTNMRSMGQGEAQSLICQQRLLAIGGSQP